MAWTSMHFAVGMCCGGAATGIACVILRRGWQWIPAAMTACGIWALVPDAPRLWREDFPWLPFAATLGDIKLERWLHSFGDLFFFHKQLDAQPHEFALHGLGTVLILYNLSIVLLMYMERRQRLSLANRAWQAHASLRGKPAPNTAAASAPPHVEVTSDSDPHVIARVNPGRFSKSG